MITTSFDNIPSILYQFYVQYTRQNNKLPNIDVKRPRSLLVYSTIFLYNIWKGEKGMKEKTKKNSIGKIFYIIVSLLAIATSGYAIYHILLLNTIENLIRYIIIGIIGIIDFIILIRMIVAIKSKKQKKRRISTILMILYSILMIAIALIIGYLYGKLEDMNKNIVTYTTSLVAMKSSGINSIGEIKDMDLGIIGDTEATDYIIAQSIIYPNKLNEKNNIIEYDQVSELVQALYDEEVDAIFINSNYVTQFASTPGFETIADDTKVITSASEEMENKDSLSTETSTAQAITEPITVLLMGVDSDSDTLKASTSFNGDSLILATFNPDTLSVTMLSIQRDSYVPIACFANQKENKITHAAWQGASCMIDTIENLTGIPINYYIKIDFKGVVDLVDAVGGVDIDVEYPICEQNSKRQFGNHTVYIEEGFQTLTGEQALAYARNRHTWPQYCPAKYNTHYRSDATRAIHQQEVIKGVLAKLKNIKSVAAFQDILNSISNNIETNFSPSQILSFYNIAKDIISQNTDNGGNILSIQSLELETTNQWIYDESMGMVLSDEIVNQDSLKKVIQVMKVNLGLEEPELIKTFTYSANEPYEQKNAGSTDVATKLYDLLPDLTSKTRSSATSWANSHNIEINWKVVSSGGADGEIIAQNYPEAKRLDLIPNRTITLTIVEKSSSTEEDETEESDETQDEEKEEDDNKKPSTPTPSPSPKPTKEPEKEEDTEE